MEENPDLTEYNGVIVKGVDINGDIVDATKKEYRDGIVNSVNPTINSILNGAGDTVVKDVLNIVGENIEVIKDDAFKFQWKIITKTGIKYVRKIPLVSGTTIVVTLNEASKNMSDDEFKEYAIREISKTGASYVGSAAVGGMVGGPAGVVAGVLVGPAFEKAADMGVDRVKELLNQ